MGEDTGAAAGQQGAGDASPSTPESVTSREDLAALLAERQVVADMSLREIQAWAERAGGTRLPRATCADMLAARRLPRKAVMVAFLRACRVPAERLPAWERAWERVRVAETRPRTGPATDPGGSEAAADGARGAGQPAGRPPGRPEARTERGPGARRVRPAVLVAVAIAGTTTILAAGIAYEARGHGSTGPGGRAVVDDGRAFSAGGSSRFTVTVDPANTGVRLTRRLDAGIAWQRASITVNGAMAGMWRGLPGSPVYRWRDQTVELPAELTAHRRSLTVTNMFVSSSQDFNEFTYIVEHKIDGAWSRADSVDVGLDHPVDEAAHRYRITGQTFADTRIFRYAR